MQRSLWATLLSTLWVQIALVVGVSLILMVFIGFIVDPFINLCSGPVDSVYNKMIWERNLLRSTLPNGYTVPNGTRRMGGKFGQWGEHLTKGLGFLGIFFISASLSISRNTSILIPHVLIQIVSFACHFQRVPVIQKRTFTVGNSRVVYVSWWMVLLGVVKFLKVVFSYRICVPFC